MIKKKVEAFYRAKATQLHTASTSPHSYLSLLVIFFRIFEPCSFASLFSMITFSSPPPPFLRSFKYLIAPY